MNVNGAVTVRFPMSKYFWSVCDDELKWMVGNVNCVKLRMGWYDAVACVAFLPTPDWSYHIDTYPVAAPNQELMLVPVEFVNAPVLVPKKSFSMLSEDRRTLTTAPV